MSASEAPTSYEIRDRTGKVVAVHVRVDKPDGTKEVRWKQPAGKWGLNGTKLGDLPLYGSERLDDWPEDRPVVVVEGEKAADALNEAGIILALGTVTGASKTPGPEALEVLRGREVILWTDADEAGRKHVRRVAEQLQGVADSVSVYDWPEADEKDDAADHPAVISGDKKALGCLLDDLLGAPQYKPPEPEPASKSGHSQKYNLTDVGNAERLAERHGGDLRYCHPSASWYAYDGKRLRGDDRGEVVSKAKETVRAMLREAAPESGPIDKELAKHAMSSESRTRIDAMIALSRSEPGIPVLPDELDADPWKLNCENGTLDLKTGELREHRREDLITKLAPVKYDPAALAPTFDTTLKRILPSEALRRFLQKAIGYALTGDVSEQVLLFLHGTGANGKSTILNIIMDALGDYAMQAAPDLLVVKKGAHPTEIAELKGARFVSAIEVDDGRYLAENLVKQMTGGDRLKGRFMRQDFFQFSPTHKVFLAANHKPEVKGTDYAIWRRVKLIPFEVTITPEEQDPKLSQKLRGELPGILRWAVEGCLLWQKEGLNEPAEVTAATKEYRGEMDVLAGFIEERCVIHGGVWAEFALLYGAYKDWCEKSGEPVQSKRKFGMRLKERGFPPAKGTDNVSIRTGIALHSDREPPDGPPDDGDPEPEKNPENYSSTVNYSDSGMNGSFDPRKTSTPEQGTDEYLSNSGDPVEEFFASPPDWLTTQLEKCRGEEGRFFKPTCASIAGEVFGTVTRWAEVEPVLRSRLAEGGRAS